MTDPNLVTPSYNQIYKTLFIGNQATAEQLGNHFDLVINCTNHIKNVFIDGSGNKNDKHNGHNRRTKYIRIPVNDPGYEAPMSSIDVRVMTFAMEKLIPIIDYHVNKGERVLVHCHAGMQRSAIMCAAYIYYIDKSGERTMEDHLNNSINYVIRQRPIAFMGGKQVNFKHALYSWAKEHGWKKVHLL